jgi:hypothetical protein
MVGLGMETRDLLTASTVEQSVSSLDGIVDSVRTCSIVDLPQSKANLRHLVAIVQRNVGSVDSHGSEEVAIGKTIPL